MPEFGEALTEFYNKLITGSVTTAPQFFASRLVALTKFNGKVRPIAIGEIFCRMFSSLVFCRLKHVCVRMLNPFQYGIGVIEGASVCARTVKTLLFANCRNYCLTIDFSNTFNSVSRQSIYDALVEFNLQSFIPVFNVLYGSHSNLIFNSNFLTSSSGVKQGDPLGPFFFCIVIHSLVKKTNLRGLDIENCAYMDDLNQIGPIELLQENFTLFVNESKAVGLSVNPSKCGVWGFESASIRYDNNGVV
ncbi:hypothetical protein RCL1_002354 [Eukaryota sp. TZLM3-RCL]